VGDWCKQGIDRPCPTERGHSNRYTEQNEHGTMTVRDKQLLHFIVCCKGRNAILHGSVCQGCCCGRAGVRPVPGEGFRSQRAGFSREAATGTSDSSELHVGEEGAAGGVRSASAGGIGADGNGGFKCRRPGASLKKKQAPGGGGSSARAAPFRAKWSR